MKTPKDLFRFGFLELQNSSSSPQLDSKILLEHSLKKQNLNLITSNFLVSAQQEESFKKLIDRRKLGEPIAYIVGYQEFFGLKFNVSVDTLIPRPDSEILVEEAIKILQSNNNIKTIFDLCSGSGCLIISLIKNVSDNIKGYAVDVCEKSLEVAKQNSINLSTNHKISFNQANILTNSLEFIEPNSLVISNPPYIKTKEIASLQKDVKNFEPFLALNGGDDGLIFYNVIAKKSKKANFVVVEIGQFMEEDIINIFIQEGYDFLYSAKDLSGVERVLIFKFTDL